jgi:pyruvate dehydrogenase E1 component alpha subunit
VRKVCDEVVRLVRGGAGPALIEATCYRYQGHSMTDPGRYRARAEEELWRKRDPIPRLAKSLVDDSITTEERLREIEREIERAVEEAVAFADASPDPPLSALYDDVFAERYPSDPHA